MFYSTFPRLAHFCGGMHLLHGYSLGRKNKHPFFISTYISQKTCLAKIVPSSTNLISDLVSAMFGELSRPINVDLLLIVCLFTELAACMSVPLRQFSAL